jgi:hypothetical protein
MEEDAYIYSEKLLIFAEKMEHRDIPEDMEQESLMAPDEQREVLSCHPCGSGLPPAKIKPGRAFPHDHGTIA